MLHPYHAKEVLIATMHGKEQVIQNIFQEKIGCNVAVAKDFNTDLFGSFSGEIERKNSAYETLKLKAITAAERFDYDYVIASEGSFGPHANYLCTVNTEMLLFFDRVRQLFITEHEVSLETNISKLEVDREMINSEKFDLWLQQVKFPSHALIIKFGNGQIHKGINSRSDLVAKIASVFSEYKSATVETDMRAMMNPTRMMVIKKVAEKLLKRVATLCSICNTPGFGLQRFTGGLHCQDCNSITRIPSYRELSCIVCAHKIVEPLYIEEKQADPTYCDYCNP